MGRIGPFGIVGGLLAVALVAHVWMLPSFVDTSTDPAGHATSVAPVDDAPHAAECPSGMSGCVSTDIDRVLPLLLTALSTSSLLLQPAPRPVSGRSSRSSRRGPPPRLTPVTERVLLLE